MNGGLFIGLMSGTSADGIDAVLVQSDGERSTLLATQHRPMPQQLREEILAFRHPGNNELHRLATLDAQLADEYAAATAALLQAARISAAVRGSPGSPTTTTSRGSPRWNMAARANDGTASGRSRSTSWWARRTARPRS